MPTSVAARRRVDRVLTALRTFGIGDDFDICALFGGDALPSRAAVLARLEGNPLALPRGVSARYLADYILMNASEDVSIHGGILKNNNNATAPLTIADADELGLILTGTQESHDYASRYHRHVRRLIGGLFVDKLVDVGSEVPQFGGVGQIDLVFRNDATSGVFANINGRFGTRGAFVPVECKNSKGAPQNREVAQLLSRLNDKFGTLGILACRTVDDRDTIFERCAPYVAVENKWILVLSDADFREMLDAHLAGDAQATEAPLNAQLQRLSLGSRIS